MVHRGFAVLLLLVWFLLVTPEAVLAARTQKTVNGGEKEYGGRGPKGKGECKVPVPEREVSRSRSGEAPSCTGLPPRVRN